jgi:hypothetical protein
MDEHLKLFYEADPGFAQYVDRYKIVAATPQVLKDYESWKIDEFFYQAELQEIKDEAKAEGEAKARAEAEAKAAKAEAEAIKAKDFDISVKSFHRDNPKNWDKTFEWLKSCNIPESTIRKAKKQVKAELDKEKA